MNLPVGTPLGPYEIVGAVGSGGMGEVYRARDPRLHREVAIKVLPPAFAEDDERLRRFEQEARAAGILNHPNILAIYDFGAHAGAPYVVSELLEGETLRHRIGGHALSPRKAVEIAIQIAHGLAAAHQRGIVHRDLKPENIFITREGRAKILDFGLAKLTRPEGDGQALSRAATVGVDTGPGAVWGTAGYMSPEQVRGKSVDHRSDIFAFGAILYEMLSGQRAFRGDSPADTMSAILREDPEEITSTGHAVPPALDRIVRHCLEKNPEERFQSASDLAFDLESITGISGSSSVALAGADAAGAPSRVARAGFVVAACAATVLGSYWLGSTVGGGGSKTLPEFQQVTFGRGDIVEARFSPDGNTIVYSAAWDGEPPKTFTTRAESPESRDIGLPAAVVHSISRTGEMLVEIGRERSEGGYTFGTIARIPLAGGTPREILQGVMDAAWDGSGNQLAVIRSEAGKQRIEYPPGTVLYETTGMPEDLRFSPDGARIAFVDHPLPGDTRGEVATIDVATRKKTAISSGWLDVDEVAWHPTGTEVWFTATKSGLDRALYAASLSGSLRAIAAIPGSLTLQDIDPKGRVLLTRVTQRTRIRALAPGETKERELSWFDWSMVRDITSDGRMLLFDESGEGGGTTYATFLRGMNGAPPVRLAEGAAGAISPDGKTALAVEPDEFPRLKSYPVGPGEPKEISTDSVIVGRVKYTRDGTRILIRGHRRGEQGRWWWIPAAGGKAVPIDGTEETGRFLASSPDGKSVAFARKGGRVRIQPLEGGKPREIAFADSTQYRLPVQWSEDGRHLYALSRKPGAKVDVYKIDVQTGAETLWKGVGPQDPTGVFVVPEVVVASGGNAYAYSFTQILGDLYLATGLR